MIFGFVIMMIGENWMIELVNVMMEIWNLIIGLYIGEIVGLIIWLFFMGFVGEVLLFGGKLLVRGEVWCFWFDFNVLFSVVLIVKSSFLGVGLVSGYECMMWLVGDWVYYGCELLDCIVFYCDE